MNCKEDEKSSDFKVKVGNTEFNMYLLFFYIFEYEANQFMIIYINIVLFPDIIVLFLKS